MQLDIFHLTCRYGEIRACGPISFELKSGQSLAVRGINGAGKTSLLRSIAGCESPDVSGRILFDGHTVGSAGRFAGGVALVPEGRHIFGPLTVTENLTAAGAFLPRRERKNRIAEVCRQIPLLEEMGRRKAGLLSGGQQQLLAVGRALMAKPSILLVDEPFLGLSPRAADQVADLMKREKQRGTTVIFTCQDDPSAASMADLALVLLCGTQTYFGPFSDSISVPLMP